MAASDRPIFEREKPRDEALSQAGKAGNQKVNIRQPGVCGHSPENGEVSNRDFP